MSLAQVIVGLVAVQRFFEMLYAARNTRALLARGAVEAGRGHYPLIIALHAAWLAAIFLALGPRTTINWFFLGAFLALQAGRVWTIASLGPYWTTRIITIPGVPLTRRGPYRYLRHPNYLIVAGEIAVLPLVFGLVWVAIIFSLLNGAVLAWRITIENAALKERVEN